MFVRAYLRASTQDQDANRAEGQLKAFAKDHGLKIAAWYRENESGTKLDRPELFKLLSDAQEGDVLLIEQVDRLSRLDESDWKKLRAMIDAKGVRIVALDLPTSHQFIGANADSFTGRVLAAVNGMVLDILAATARKDYEDRRRRQSQGIAKAKTDGKFKGRPENVDRNAGIEGMLNSKMSWGDIQKATGCGRATIAKIVKRMKDQKAA
ncbi:DNA invertase Pin-like site-specific DNA recombinase [Bradyrhizobium japonicum]|uniref:Recombinase family protein n=1 Tax=Bradyrhizobium barranii subsp. barranii TaxID=2823807 RepID=A0A939M6N0_9BRAD|nr:MULTISPECIES: recombinase family protein [Bradyrhizobium]MBR0879349.1 recombinase family protein [Bradyrhizobium liaoningense]MBR0999897.1 recombinase family protein [Bradyrhizobium liaoningense]MBR1029952.1 recombinase family protein [Bradyrhizobium liaoningense]MBR1069534.1 recombinase family protein [Bradyrhizobium liaoningense]UEM16851.1 recombinase family protein [Bradyrhizobium barranii subsp. barranii]